MPHLASEPLRWTTREDTDLRGTLAPLPSPAWFGSLSEHSSLPGENSARRFVHIIWLLVWNSGPSRQTSDPKVPNTNSAQLAATGIK